MFVILFSYGCQSSKRNNLKEKSSQTPSSSISITSHWSKAYALEKSFIEAHEFCESLQEGGKKWRLPSVGDFLAGSMSNNLCSESKFWTNEEVVGREENAWVYNIQEQYKFGTDKEYMYSVKCFEED
jgi:hypothetical protein